MDQEKIGKYICELRKKNNLTQNELAEKLEITCQAVSKWERGKGIPDIYFLNKLSEIFDVEISEILNGESKPKENNKKKKIKKIIIIILSIIILILILLLIIQKENNFNFNNITSDNSCFLVHGVAAYNKNKKSIYISNIECSTDNDREYLDIECVLYEKNNNRENIILEYGNILDIDNYDLNNLKTLNELLNNIELNIDNYSCECNSKVCNNLYIRVNALNKDNKIVTYNIPLELQNNCSAN